MHLHWRLAKTTACTNGFDIYPALRFQMVSIYISRFDSKILSKYSVLKFSLRRRQAAQKSNAAVFLHLPRTRPSWTTAVSFRALLSLSLSPSLSVCVRGDSSGSLRAAAAVGRQRQWWGRTGLGARGDGREGVRRVCGCAGNEASARREAACGRRG